MAGDVEMQICLKFTGFPQCADRCHISFPDIVSSSFNLQYWYSTQVFCDLGDLILGIISKFQKGEGERNILMLTISSSICFLCDWGWWLNFKLYMQTEAVEDLKHLC